MLFVKAVLVHHCLQSLSHLLDARAWLFSWPAIFFANTRLPIIQWQDRGVIRLQEVHAVLSFRCLHKPPLGPTPIIAIPTDGLGPIVFKEDNLSSQSRESRCSFITNARVSAILTFRASAHNLNL